MYFIFLNSPDIGWTVWVKRCYYLRVNYSILIILSYVVIYKDVLYVLVKGVDPHRLPPTDGEGISNPPGQKTTNIGKGLEKLRIKPQNPQPGFLREAFCIPVIVVLKSSQTLHGAEVLVQTSLSIARGHPLLSSIQDDSLLAAADLARSHSHAQLSQEQEEESEIKKRDGELVFKRTLL